MLPVAYVLAVAVYWSGLHLVVPRNRGHIRPIAQFVNEHAQPADTIYVFDMQSFRCYGPPDDPRLRKVLDPADQIPTRRFWIVWSFGSKHGQDKPAPALNWAREFCREETKHYGSGAAAVLFEKLDGKFPSTIDPPYDGLDVPQGRKRASNFNEGK